VGAWDAIHSGIARREPAEARRIGRLSPAAMSVEWRLLRFSDIGAAHELNRIAGWNQTELDWAGYLEFEPNGCLAAVMEGQLAGTATAIRYSSALGWIGMVLVHPRFRRLGLGTQLLEHSIRYLTEKGTRSIRLDATPMGRPVYLPLGFKDEHEITRLEGPGPRMWVGLEAAASGGGPAHLAPMDLDPVADLDAEAFGVRRPEVLRSLSRRNPELCFVAKDAQGITGYLIARDGREAVQVGPGVATEPLVAARLLSALLGATAGRRVFLDVPTSHLSALGTAEARAFKVQRAFTRMVLGDAAPLGRPEWILATSGAEKG
jgi:GNAT superfamily N-acetyltransferase